MPTEEQDAESYIARVRLVGDAGEGPVKQLPGFRKGRHTVPDSVSPATQSFFARIVADRVAAEGEDWFQRAKAELKTKRRELTLEVAAPGAVLTAKDFIFEISYRLQSDDPTRFEGQHLLHDVQNSRLQAASFDRLFAGLFNEIVFELTKGVSVEEVIDAVEELDGETGLQVDYPADCSHCTLRVDGVGAEVVCDGSSLRMVFATRGSPSELVGEFAAVRHAFRISKKATLAGLLA